MKQTLEQRRQHHQTREDRQRKVNELLQHRIAEIKLGRGLRPHSLPVYEREAANISRKLGL